MPFGYFFWKSLTLRVGDTWPMFLWPAGFAATAINLAMLPREGWPEWMITSTNKWARVAVISGIAFVVGVFFYYVAVPWNLIGRADPVGGEAGYEQVAARAQDQLQKTGATWIATTDYRTYAMLRWYFNGRVPVIQINERGRFQGFRDPGMNLIRDHAGLYVAREPDNRLPIWDFTSAKRQPLERVERSWRGVVMDTYALEKLTGWTPELSPPPDTPLFRWRVLAGNASRECHSSPSRLRRRSLARSPSAGRGSAANGSGRVTSIAARPSRAVSRPLSTPSPSRCESFAAMPWPSICCTRLSPTAMPPVTARCAMTWRIRRSRPSVPGRPP